MRKTARSDTGGDDMSVDNLARQTKEDYRKALEKQIEEGKRNKADEARRKREADLEEEARIRRDMEKMNEREQDQRLYKGQRDPFAPSLPYMQTGNSFGRPINKREIQPPQVNSVYFLAAAYN